MNNPALQRVLSLFLCALMCATLLPVSALAESEATEGSVPEALNVEESVAEPAGDGALDVLEAVEEPALDPAEDGVPDVPETIEEPTEEPNEEQVRDGILDVPETIEEQEITEPPVTEETIVEDVKVAAEEDAFEALEDEGVVWDSFDPIITIVDADLPDNLDDLYAEQALDSLYPRRNGLLRAPKNVGGSLTGPAAVLYNELKPIIAQIAAGECASTQITISFSTLFNGKEKWTPAELGVESFTKDGVPNGQIVWDAIYNYMGGTAPVIRALLADCPYELYWYDKTLGTESVPDGIVFYSGGTVAKLRNFCISFKVAEEYRADSDLYTVNTALGQQVQSAVSNAQAIVSAAASYSLLDKLDYYRQRICDLVSYNDGAAGGGVAYGNPWQLIWVFDNDSSTNVVCEGYAKAFQYLCDLSDIGSATCYTVTGNMAYGTGAGNHMWNIVTMPDGKNYLVDITNCDSGSVGYPAKLFLKGYDQMSNDPNTGYLRYTFSGVTYTFDEMTSTTFSEADLTLSATDYGVVDHIPGDVNGDGKANNKDVTRLKRYLKFHDVEIVEAAGDVNGDGKINNKDVTRLKRYLKFRDVEIH